MLVRRLVLENVRSFLDRTEVTLDGNISILIGPNGGGKTNLLDAIVVMLRRHLFASQYIAHSPTADEPNRHEFRYNDALNQLVLEKHSLGGSRDQVIEVEIEVTKSDIDSMRSIKDDAEKILQVAAKKYANLPYQNAASWHMDLITIGQRISYRLVNGAIDRTAFGPGASDFHQFLQMSEIDSQIREEFELSALSIPVVYLPINRTANPLNSNVELASYNQYEQRRQSDAAISRGNFSLSYLAIARLAQRYRLLLEKDNGLAADEFKKDPSLQKLTEILSRLGYDWELISTAPLRNAYDVKLIKQGSSFVVGRASSGERELLTYLFIIFSLNIRDALIIVDEPELHLHPKWQALLLDLFEELSGVTGNQFLIATHSPKFVSTKSINYVSRVFSRNQRSHVVRLGTTALPDGRDLLNIVNTQNNEKIFFADRVLLVEGMTDKIVIEAVLDELKLPSSGLILEVISVGGKGLFKPYRDVLDACGVPGAVLADLDYIEQIGSEKVKSLLSLNSKEIKQDIIDNPKSKDGDSLVAAIDRAIESGSWKEAEEVWSYIKGRRLKLRADLSEDDRQVLDEFLLKQASEWNFLLRRGDLEDYLPVGFKGKDVRKLIKFVSDESFWRSLDESAREELAQIVSAVCK